MPLKDIVDLMAEELPKDTFWIEPRILPHGGKLAIAAPQKAGKSFTLLSLAAGLVRGGQIFGKGSWLYAPHSCRVLLVDAELGEHRLQENARLVMSGSDAPSKGAFFYTSRERGLCLDTPEGVRKLMNYVADCKPQVLILDPISRLLETADENSHQHMGTVLNRIDDILAIGKPWGMSVIITHHTRKAQHERGLKVSNDLDIENIRGALGAKLKDFADAIIVLGNKEIRAHSPHSWWTLDAAWELRHGPQPPNTVLALNRNNDRKVTYFGGGGPSAPVVPAATGLSPLPSAKGTKP